MNTKDKLKALEKVFDANREYLNKNMEILHEYVDEKITAKEYRDWETDRKSTRLNSSHSAKSRMPSSA